MKHDEYKPLVSIVMNCYNGQEFLYQALESIRAQHYTNWEVVFWDNQSIDNSAEIFKSYKDSRFKYYYAKTHTTLYKARNLAITKCGGELVAFLDVDDWWYSEKIGAQVVLFNNKNIGISCTNYIKINERRKNTTKVVAYSHLPSKDVLNNLLGDYFVHMSTLMVRKIAIDKLKYVFDSRFDIIGDMDFVLRLSKDWEMGSIQTPMAYYRWHDNNAGYISNYKISDEFNIWYSESKNKAEYAEASNFRKLAEKIDLYKILKCLNDGERIKALANIKNISPYRRIKLIVAVFLPNFLVRKLIKGT